MTPKSTEKNTGSFNEEYTDDMINLIAQTLSDKKAENIVIMDLRGITTLADYFIICSALSDVHVKSLADNVTEKTRVTAGEKPWRQEGVETRRWVVLDYVNIVVHIFKEEARSHYAIEKMWSDAKTTEFKD